MQSSFDSICFLITLQTLSVFLMKKYPQPFCMNLPAVLNLTPCPSAFLAKGILEPNHNLEQLFIAPLILIHAGLHSCTEFFLGWGCIHLLGQAYLIVCEGRSSVQGGMDKWTRQMRNCMQWYMSMDVRIKMKCRMCRFFRIHKLVPSRQASSCKCRDC